MPASDRGINPSVAARLRELWCRILFLLRIRRVEHDIEQEFATHLEIAAEVHQRNGMTAEEARRAAALAFGSRGVTKELADERRTIPGMESFFKDVIYGLGKLKANPRFTLAAVLMLGVSIGTNATVITLTNAALFKGYPQVERNDRLLYLTLYPDCCISYPTYLDWREMAKSFRDMAAVHDGRRAFSDGDNSVRTYYATEVTANTFQLVGRQPMLGRDFTHSDELPGAMPVVILSYRLWDERYNRSPVVLGRTVRLNGEITTIIGVMPKRFSFPQNQDLWVPMRPTAAIRDRSNVVAIWYVLGRLSDGVSVESARTEMADIGKRLGKIYPKTDDVNPLVRTFPDFFIRSQSIDVYKVMIGAVSFLLLIACANLTNLLLARSIDRSRELAVRLALGASRWRVARQLLVESVLLSVPGGLLGWCIANYGIRVYAHFADGGGLSSWTGVWFANIIDYSIDSRVLGYLLTITVGTGLLFGVLPAVRLSKLDIQHVLNDGGRGATSGARGRHLSRLLVIGETALTVVLLAGSAVMVRSVLKVYTADIGFNPSRELMLTLVLPQSYTEPEMISFASRLQTRLKMLPEVDAVAISNTRPFFPMHNRAYEVADSTASTGIEDARSLPKTSWAIATPGYFQSLGRSMISGRDFSDADSASRQPVVIVNRQFAVRVWPHENAIGKHLRFFDKNTVGPWLTVVGVAPDIAQGDLMHPLYKFLPEVYVPYRQSPSNVISVQALTRIPPANLGNDVYREIHAIDPAMPLAIVPQSMADNLDESRRYQNAVILLFLIFAVVALLLASLGLYAVVAHSVSRRTQEIGVRISLGATTAQILRLVSSQAFIPVAAGLAAGLTASLAVNRVLDAFIDGVSPSDPIALAGATVVLIVFATLGCLIPASRAARIDPASAIRYE